MKNNERAPQSPTKGILKRFLILIPLVVVLAIGSFAYKIPSCTVWLFAGSSAR